MPAQRSDASSTGANVGATNRLASTASASVASRRSSTRPTSSSAAFRVGDALARSIPSRVIVYARDSGICWLCSQPCPLPDGNQDHIVPRAHKGPDVISNLRWSHSLCNLRRGGRVIPSPHDFLWTHFIDGDVELMRRSLRRYRSWWQTIGCPPEILDFLHGGPFPYPTRQLFADANHFASVADL